MPYCDDCEKFWNPNSMPVDGRCPTCGIQIAEPQDVEEDDYKAPWHFKLLVGAVCVYLAWRLVQLGEWLF